MSYRSRQLVTAALVANTMRPMRGLRSAWFSFFPGWMAGELSGHLTVMSVADTAVQVLRKRPVDKVGLALAAFNLAGLGRLLWLSSGAGKLGESVLSEHLGADYSALLSEDDLRPSPLPWAKLANPFRFTDPRVRVDRDVRYSEHGSRGLLDVYRPKDRDLTDAPVLLHVHGGAWTIGNKEQQGLPLINHMAAKGWVVVTINYRLSPRSAFPAHLVDVKQAIAWIREHIAEYGGDPAYVAITGGSAGGHLVALAGLTANDPEYQPGFEDVDTHVDAVVPFYGVYDFAGASGLRNAEVMRDAFLAPKVLQRRFSADPEAFEKASPLLRVREDAPDFCVVHGTHDSIVHVDQARTFVERLREISKGRVTYVELPGAQHAFEIFPSLRQVGVLRTTDRFLSWHRAQHLARETEAAR